MKMPPFWKAARFSVCWLAVVVLLALPCIVAAAEPVLPAPQGFVSDFAGVVDLQARQRIEAVNAELKSKTGSEIAVLVVHTTQPLEAFDYAMKVAEKWRPGDAGKDNGVLFLVAVDDRAMHILTGYGVEGALPDGRVGEIRDRVILPAFRGGDYSGGILSGVETLAGMIAAEYGVKLSGVRPPRPVPSEFSPAQLFLLLLVLFFVLWILSRSGGLPMVVGGPYRNSSGGFGGFGGDFGGGFGGGGGGFGGFGGGDFGGGGAGGKW